MMDARNEVREGMTVRSSDGEKLGKVIACSEDHFLVEKGIFFPKDYLARYGEVSEVRDGEIVLDFAARDFAGRSAQTAGAGAEPEGRMAGSTGISTGGATEEVKVPLVEEELTAEKRQREAGQVQVRKEVVTEQRQITVPVTKEEVHVERVPASGEARPGDASFQEGTISVPVREEEVEIRKRPVVREEVRVSKTARQVERRADAEVRKEEARIEKTGDLDRTGEPDEGGPKRE